MMGTTQTRLGVVRHVAACRTNAQSSHRVCFGRGPAAASRTGQLRVGFAVSSLIAIPFLSRVPDNLLCRAATSAVRVSLAAVPTGPQSLQGMPRLVAMLTVDRAGTCELPRL